MPLYQY